MISAVVFDMDGLLIDSEPFWRQSEQEIFASVGLHLTWEDCGSTMGQRIDEVVRHWSALRPWKATPITEDEVQHLAKTIVERVISLVVSEGQAMTGCYEILEFFQRRGIRLGLASSSLFILIDAVLERLGLRKYFTVVHSAELEPRGKPAPDVYLSACRKLGVDPKNALAFEDSPGGIISAKAAGMKCIAVPEMELPVEVAQIADHILPNLAAFDEGLWQQLQRRV